VFSVVAGILTFLFSRWELKVVEQELLIVVGIISVLSVAAVLVLNPAELLRSARDSGRLNDAQVLGKALSFYEFATVSIGADWDGPNYQNSCKGESDQKI